MENFKISKVENMKICLDFQSFPYNIKEEIKI